MKKIRIEKAGLLGSASALGLNWIYDRELLNEHKQNLHPMIFESIDHELYKKAKNGFDVYPNHRLGDLDFMGEVLYLFFMYFEYEKKEELNLARWRKIFYEYFREDYEYDGYIESYGKAFLQTYARELSGEIPVTTHTDHIDTQLAGLLFIIGVYDQNKSVDKISDAIHYAKTITADPNINDLTLMLFTLLQLLDQGSDKKEALQKSLVHCPKEYKESMEQAIQSNDLDDFIKTYSGVACGLEQSLPLIYYIIGHTDSWKESLVLNATLGGASSARGIFISAIVSRFEEIPEKYIQYLQYQI